VIINRTPVTSDVLDFIIRVDRPKTVRQLDKPYKNMMKKHTKATEKLYSFSTANKIDVTTEDTPIIIA